MTAKPRRKAFPHRCPACLRKAVQPAVVAYEAEVTYDGRVYRVRVADLRTPRCEACGELVFGNEVDEQISGALREQLGLLPPNQIRAARRKLHLKQTELAERIGVAPEAVSRWESGTVIQPRAMDNLMRVFFAFPEVQDALVGRG